jgi:hypothetical protein
MSWLCRVGFGYVITVHLNKNHYILWLSIMSAFLIHSVFQLSAKQEYFMWDCKQFVIFNKIILGYLEAPGM